MKQIGSYNVLDNSESSGSKIISKVPIAHKLCVEEMDDIDRHIYCS